MTETVITGTSHIVDPSSKHMQVKEGLSTLFIRKGKIERQLFHKMMTCLTKVQARLLLMRKIVNVRENPVDIHIKR